MMTLMMVGQLLAVLVVGSSATALLPTTVKCRKWRASNKWSQSSDRYRLSFGWSSAFADEEGTRKDNREWQTFTEERLANTDSFIL